MKKIDGNSVERKERGKEWGRERDRERERGGIERERERVGV